MAEQIKTTAARVGAAALFLVAFVGAIVFGFYFLTTGFDVTDPGIG